MKYFNYTYDEKISDYIKEEMTKKQCRDFLTFYYGDNEMLDIMLENPQDICTLFGFVRIEK